MGDDDRLGSLACCSLISIQKFSMGSQRVRHDLATEQQNTFKHSLSLSFPVYKLGMHPSTLPHRISAGARCDNAVKSLEIIEGSADKKRQVQTQRQSFEDAPSACLCMTPLWNRLGQNDQPPLQIGTLRHRKVKDSSKDRLLVLQRFKT